MQVSVLLLLTAIQLHSTLLTQGAVIEGPSNVIYLPGLTPLPIELICDVTGVATWRVDDETYTLGELNNGALPGHNRTGTNILVNSPVNNTEYVCVSTTNDGDTRSDPAYIIIAGVPAMVPDVTVDDINVNGDIVTLTLSWGEPFNNLDPIVNYTVSCSGDVRCLPNFTTTDNTTRSYTIMNLAIGPTYTLSVVATNSIGSGKAGTAPPGIPTMVPSVMIDDSSIHINGNNIALTLSWGEPFNNFDTIVNYTVSCSGDETCPNFNTTDNTTRSYTVTNLTPGTNYTFSVVATNSIGSGAAGVVMITTPPEIEKVTGVMLMCGLVDLNVQCNVTWNPVTQGNITGYQVYYNGTMTSVSSPNTTLTFTATRLLLLDGTILVVNVAAINRYGIGPASNTSTINITVSSVTSTTVTIISPNDTSTVYNITVTCTIHPNSTADQCVVMAMADGKDTITGAAPTTNGTATVTINGLECGITYAITARGTLNGILIGLRSYVETISKSCPIVATSKPDTDTLIIVIIIVVIIIVVGVGVVGIIIIVIIIYRKNKNTATEKENGKCRSDKQKLAKSNKVSSEDDIEGAQSPPGVYRQMNPDPPAAKQMATQPPQYENAQVDKSKPNPSAAKQLIETQPPQSEYALVDKSKSNQPPAKQPEGDIQYLDLDIQKGPDRYRDQEHAVEYGQVVETKQ